MDKEDIGNLSEDKWVCSQHSGSSFGLSLEKEEICDIGKRGMNAGWEVCGFEDPERDMRKRNE